MSNRAQIQAQPVVEAGDRFPGRVALGLSRSRLGIRVLVVLATIAIYSAVFVLAFERLERVGIAFALIPVILSGIAFGSLRGFLTGILAIPLNLGLFALAGDPEPLSRLGLVFWAAHFAFLFMGTVAGIMSSLWRRLRRELEIRQNVEAELQHIARHDPLTGVLNRLSLDEILAHELARARRYNHPVGFLMIDINRFKEVNDRFGHQTGDLVLQTVAALLSDCIRETDYVVRYGGDEFVVVLPETDGDTELVRQRIQASVEARNLENPVLEFPVTLAIGAIHYDPGQPRSMDEILHEADRRMYEDKGKQHTTHS